MSSDDRVSILICQDAGTASSNLLARDDLRIRWALTDAEVESVIRLTRCSVCITREPLAKAALGACAVANREVAPIVLLDPAQWTAWRDYMIWVDPFAEASSVLQTTAGDQLLDELADATGVLLRTGPQIAYQTAVRITSREQYAASTSLNVSATGLSIVDVPPHSFGSDVTLAFAIASTQFEVSAIVSRISRVNGKPIVGLTFQNVAPEQQALLDELIRIEQANAPPIVEPEEEEVDPLDDTTVLALRTASAKADTLTLIQTLIANKTVERSETAKPWLIGACDAFSLFEVAAVMQPQVAPAWTQLAMHARLRAYYARSVAGGGPPDETDARDVFELAHRIAESAAGSDEVTLVQITNIRAGILRALYDPAALAPT